MNRQHLKKKNRKGNAADTIKIKVYNNCGVKLYTAKLYNNSTCLQNFENEKAVDAQLNVKHWSGCYNLPFPKLLLYKRFFAHTIIGDYWIST